MVANTWCVITGGKLLKVKQKASEIKTCTKILQSYGNTQNNFGFQNVEKVPASNSTCEQNSATMDMKLTQQRHEQLPWEVS